MSAVVLSVEGILKDHRGTPIDGGIMLFESLKKGFSVVLVSSETNLDKVNQWLQIAGVKGAHYLLVAKPEDSEEDEKRWLAQMKRAEATLTDIRFVVVADPGVAAVLTDHSFPVLLSVRPEYLRPEFRPDHKHEVTPWDTLVANVDRQRTMRAADSRPYEEVL